MKFYMTCERRESLENPISETGAAVMQNAVNYYDTTGFNKFQPYNTEYVIDSGGYTAMDKYGGEFPWTVQEYHEWLQETYNRHPFDWAAVMDFACEEAFDDILSVKERMDKTLENTLELVSIEPDYPILPVLQGREINDYLSFYDRLKDHGINTEYVGIGTVCRLSSSKELVRVEEAVRANTDIKRIHGFGVKISSFKQGVTFDTADSQAWTWPMKFGLKLTPVRNGRGEVVSMKRDQYGSAEDHYAARQETFKAYYGRAKKLLANSHGRTMGDRQSTFKQYG